MQEESAKFIPNGKPRTLRVNGTFEDIGVEESEKFWAKVNEYQDRAIIKSLCYRTGFERRDSNLTGLIDYKHFTDLEVEIARDSCESRRRVLDKLSSLKIHELCYNKSLGFELRLKRPYSGRFDPISIADGLSPDVEVYLIYFRKSYQR